MKRFISFGAMVLIIFSVHSGRAGAMGDFGSVAHGFWSDVIASYWWETREDWRLSRDALRPYSAQVADTILDEREPLGLTTTYKTSDPPDAANVSCLDFQAVPISQISPDDSRGLPFRVHYPKSAMYFSIEGWLAGLGMPSHADFWIAAMLPRDAPPLFISRTGINPAVLSRPFIAEMGWSEGLTSMPANSLSLQSSIPCNEFTIYHVRFDQ